LTLLGAGTVTSAKGAIGMEVNDIISAALVGAVVGVLGRLVLPGRQRIGVFVTLLIGVGAAILGTYLAQRFGVDSKAPMSFWKLNWDWIVLAIQVGCAVVFTALAALVAHSRLAANDEPKKRARAK
jgi:uncharacterized membrane protein YeaQ/YmgE (transglycosylase-associated protein family)